MPSSNLNKNIKVGIDFDNTIVCYDSIFESIARERKIQLTGKGSPKTELRDSLRKLPKGELEWTKIQGEVYGTRILEAKTYPGVQEFIAELNSKNIPFCIISHKTRFPVVGAAHDLHEWAIRWLEKNGLGAKDGVRYCFELTKESKLGRIASEACTHFIDDLPEFLNEETFPAGVQKIWFNPSNDSGADASWINVKSWDEIKNQLQSFKVSINGLASEHNVSKTEIPVSENEVRLFETLISEKLNDVVVSSERISGGANNRAYKLQLKSGRNLFGKKYFHSAFDTRDRLKHEYGFSTLLHSNGINQSAKPLIKDAVNRIGIYEYLDGKPLALNGEISDGYWESSLNFLVQLQEFRTSPDAAALPIASEASFSVDGHLANTRKRRDDWLMLAKEKRIGTELAELVTHDLEDAYEGLAEDVFSFKDFRKEISQEDRILSPSDFGMHNVLLKEDGELAFVDFEYAGWDDPAKTISDFFFQPRYPAPSKWLEPFVVKIASLLNDEHEFLLRYPLVRRCIGLKWCYILLNDFHPEASKRRTFAAEAASQPRIQDRVAEIKKRLKALKSENFAEQRK